MGRVEDVVAQLIEFQYGTKTAFARKIGIPEQTLYSVLKSSLAGASMATAMPIAEELDLDPFQLAAGNIVRNASRRGSVEVPLFGSISAGTPIEPDRADSTFPVPAGLHAEYPDAFMLRVEGTSMDRVLPDGFYVLVDPCRTIEVSGRIYVVFVGDQNATVKRVRLLSNGLSLEPDSNDPTFHSIVFDYAAGDTPTVTVAGRVVWYCPPLDWETALR